MRLLALALVASSAALLPTDPAAEARDVVTAGVVARGLDGDTFVLAGGGEVRLVGIEAPKSGPDRSSADLRTLAREAHNGLAHLAEGRGVRLDYSGTPRDRYGRWLAQVTDEAGLWLNGATIRQGNALVHTTVDNRGRAHELLALERTARGESRGLWAHPAFRVLADTETPKFIDRFRLVEGRVLAAAPVQGRLYLNFGADYRTDFTVVIARETVPLFRAAGIKPEEFAERRIRVRGWIASWNGPMIEATHPEQIERIDE